MTLDEINAKYNAITTEQVRTLMDALAPIMPEHHQPKRVLEGYGEITPKEAAARLVSAAVDWFYYGN